MVQAFLHCDSYTWIVYMFDLLRGPENLKLVFLFRHLIPFLRVWIDLQCYMRFYLSFEVVHLPWDISQLNERTDHAFWYWFVLWFQNCTWSTWLRFGLFLIPPSKTRFSLIRSDSVIIYLFIVLGEAVHSYKKKFISETDKVLKW